MSAVAMSALTASKSAAIAGGAVRAKRATPAAAPRSLVVRISFSSLVLLARSLARTPKKSHHPRGRSRSVHLENGLGRRTLRGVRRTTRGMIRMNIFLFDHRRAPGRVVARRGVGTPGCLNAFRDVRARGCGAPRTRAVIRSRDW